jgi:hypothetical protein
VRAGAQPYLGARIVSGDEMIDGVLSPRGLRPLGLWRPASAERVGGGSIAGAGRKGIGLMMGKRAAITSGGRVDELRCRRLECVVAEFAQDVVGASAEFAGDREARAVVVNPLGDFEVVGVVG